MFAWKIADARSGEKGCNLIIIVMSNSSLISIVMWWRDTHSAD